MDIEKNTTPTKSSSPQVIPISPETPLSPSAPISSGYRPRTSRGREVGE
jgi:hypothetical protein